QVRATQLLKACRPFAFHTRRSPQPVSLVSLYLFISLLRADPAECLAKTLTAPPAAERRPHPSPSTPLLTPEVAASHRNF
ncbi:hypothetical protein Csa_023771, partial [Cucumis sativus]